MDLMAAGESSWKNSVYVCVYIDIYKNIERDR